MTSFVPPSFLFRVSIPCAHIEKIPVPKGGRLLDLPAPCRMDAALNLDQEKSFADVRMAWNERGIAFQVEVKGKEQLPQGDAARVRASDGATLWLDTRDSRASHRASRYCHQFHLLPTGGGANQDEPFFSQTKIHRALEDAPIVSASEVIMACQIKDMGYRLELFLPTQALHGFDPEENPRLGFFYAIRDLELGEQLLNLGAEFPYWEDPSLWSVLQLSR